MADVAVSHPRGDTVERAYKITDFEMDTTSLDGLTILITVKTAIDDDAEDSEALLQHWLRVDAEGTTTASKGIRVGGEDPDTLLEVEGSASGVFTHFVTAEESASLGIGNYVYDVQITTSHVPPRVKTVIEAAPWSVRGDVTRRWIVPEEVQE